jgi:hypothetical protein
MTEAELRRLVRDVLARRGVAGETAPSNPTGIQPLAPAAGPTFMRHASHAMFVLPVGFDDDGGPCLIEPAVACTHCGYCRSYGH